MNENERIAMVYLIDSAVDIQAEQGLSADQMKKCLFRLALSYADQERSEQHGSV